MLQQFADHGRDAVGRGRRADGLQIAAGTERAAFAFDYQHADVVIGLDVRAELSSFFAIERSMELNATGRFSVIVAIDHQSGVAPDHRKPRRHQLALTCERPWIEELDAFK